MGTNSTGGDGVDLTAYIYSVSIDLQNQIEEDLKRSETSSSGKDNTKGSDGDVQPQAGSNHVTFSSIQALRHVLESNSTLCRCIKDMADASHEVLYVAHDLIYNATESTSSEMSINAAVFVGCKVADLAIVKACIEISEKRDAVIRWRRMRSILSDVIMLIHDRLIGQYGNMQEDCKHQNFFSQYRYTLLEFISGSFENILCLLHITHNNCPTIDRGNKMDNANCSLPEAFLFVAVLSHLFSSNLLLENHSDYAELLYRCPINFDAVLLHPYRVQRMFKFDHVSEMLNNLKLGWDEMGLAKVVEELYCSCRAWPGTYSHLYTWRLVYPHALSVLKNTHCQQFLGLLDSRVPEDIVVYSVEHAEYVVEDIKVLVDALVQSSSISNFGYSRQIHNLIKSITCHRCCFEIRLDVVQKLIQYYAQHESCGSILPLFLDLLRPMCAMPDCCIDNVAGVLEPFIKDMSETSSLADNRLMEMHEVYMSVSALMLLFVRRYGPNDGGFVSDAVNSLRSFDGYVRRKIAIWEKSDISDAPNNCFRLYLLKDALQLLLSNC